MIAAWSWVADIVLILLLAGTLGMALRLDRSLRVVRRDRGAFETLITSLSSATGAVKTGIESLKREAERAAAQVQLRAEEADKMATDLSFLIEAADRCGEKLEQRLQAASGLSAAPAATAPDAAVPADLGEGFAATDVAGPAARRRLVRGKVQYRRASVPPAPDTAPAAEPAGADIVEPVPVEAAMRDAVAPDLSPEPGPALLPSPAPAPPAAGLRELAGITTRRPPRPAREAAAPAEDGAQPAASIKPATSIKMVG